MANFDKYYAPAADIDRWRTLALGVGGITLLMWAYGAYVNTEQALLSWLLGFIFWAGIGFGCLSVLLLQYLTGGAWGVVIRGILEAGTRTLPVIVLLFIPLAIGIYTRSFFEWTHVPFTDHVMAQRGVFMTPWFWIVRSAIYFVIWGVIIYLLNKWSADQEKTKTIEDSRRVLEKISRFSGPALVVYCLVVTFASVDWMLMLDTHWSSTIWGLLFVAGWALSCFCFVVAVLAMLFDKAPMDGVIGKRHYHDLGKLILALVMVWAYFNFSQFLIIWSGNIPEETGWILTRMKGGWGFVGVGLILFHFAFPFLILLQQDFKRHANWIAGVAIFILAVRIVDMFYLIGPSNRILPNGLEQGAFQVSWMDLVGPVAVGGIWLWWFFGELMKRPMVPIRDPYLAEGIEHGRGH